MFKLQIFSVLKFLRFAAWLNTGAGVLVETKIKRHANWPVDSIRTIRKWSKAEQYNSNSVRIFAWIFFGRDNLFGCYRFISILTGRWGMANLSSSFSQLGFVLKLKRAFLLADGEGNCHELWFLLSSICLSVGWKVCRPNDWSRVVHANRDAICRYIYLSI